MIYLKTINFKLNWNLLLFIFILKHFIKTNGQVLGSDIYFMINRLNNKTPSILKTYFLDGNNQPTNQNKKKKNTVKTAELLPR